MGEEKEIDLYGFSAGGGVLINVLGVLNTSTYDARLEAMGIGAVEKEKLLAAIQRGMVILDTPLILRPVRNCEFEPLISSRDSTIEKGASIEEIQAPFSIVESRGFDALKFTIPDRAQYKSIEEIIACRSSTGELEWLAKNYRDNHFRPIDSLRLLQGLSLDVLLYFQEGDEILSNRDDDLYIERLRETQQKIAVIRGSEGGHQSAHLPLWQFYAQKMEGEDVGTTVLE